MPSAFKDKQSRIFQGRAFQAASSHGLLISRASRNLSSDREAAVKMSVVPLSPAPPAALTAARKESRIDSTSLKTNKRVLSGVS